MNMKKQVIFMTSREIIRRVIEYRDPPRIGFDFNPPHEKDILWLPAARLTNPRFEPFLAWGDYPEIKAQVPGFHGQVHYNLFGNIYGRLKNDSNGECVRGALQDGWELLDDYRLPELDLSYYEELKEKDLRGSDRFVLGSLPLSAFSTLRDARLMDNALTDTLLEEDNVRRFLDMVTEKLLEIAGHCADAGFDGLIMYDDWGMQHAPFISPATFRELFKPVYRRAAEALHARNMKLFVHSCGLVYSFMEDFIDAGVDVMQFDQPELSGSEVLAGEFGGRIAFHCPVDIQKIMATGDREKIEQGAAHMVDSFKKLCGGGLIAKDYPTWEDIEVEQEWADWARNVILARADLKGEETHD